MTDEKLRAGVSSALSRLEELYAADLITGVSISVTQKGRLIEVMNTASDWLSLLGAIDRSREMVMAKIVDAMTLTAVMVCCDAIDSSVSRDVRGYAYARIAARYPAFAEDIRRRYPWDRSEEP